MNVTCSTEMSHTSANLILRKNHINIDFFYFDFPSPKYTLLYFSINWQCLFLIYKCYKFHFHHPKQTHENLLSLDSWQIFLDRVYFSLRRFSDRFYTVEFKKNVIQLMPIFGRFYYVLVNEFMQPFIKSTHHTQGIKRKLCEWPICQK